MTPEMLPEMKDVTITRVGAQGDGVAETDAGPVFVPLALLGERVSALVSGDRGRLVNVLTASPDRVLPLCRHFGSCGGCALQHMAPAVYQEWKRDQAIAAFRSRGIDADVSAIVTPNGHRRRATLTARRDAMGVRLGFHHAASHDLVDIVECVVSDPRIVAALPGLKVLLEPLVSRRGDVRVSVTLTDCGLDVDLDGVNRSLTPDVRSRLGQQAYALGLARLTLASDVVYEAMPPVLRFGGADVRVPPVTFVQAMADAEAAMARLVTDAVGKVKSTADLFAGVGAFTFPLAARAKVFAVDSDKAAIAALTQGVRTATGIKPITTLVRDLMREPLSALELKDFDAVVFDPPRAGAEAQARMLAKSKVKTVVAVSCNLATLARDARILIDGGYRMEAVTPIDQFLYAAHIEAVVAFRR